MLVTVTSQLLGVGSNAVQLIYVYGEIDVLWPVVNADMLPYLAMNAERISAVDFMFAVIFN